MLRAGEHSAEAEAEYARVAQVGVGSLSKALGDSFRSLNREVVRSTDGRLDLGAVTALGFLGLGAAEIASMRQVPAPPWFNLAWWAFRTFTLFGREAGEEAEGATGAAEAAESEVDG